jgi:hypothetical protein
VPAKQRLRAHQERGPPGSRQDPAERGHEQPVPAAKARTARLALEDGQLVPKDTTSNLRGHLVVGGASDQQDYSAQQQMHEGEEHELNLPTPGTPDGTNGLVRVTIVLCVPFSLHPVDFPAAVTAMEDDAIELSLELSLHSKKLYLVLERRSCRISSVPCRQRRRGRRPAQASGTSAP